MTGGFMRPGRLVAIISFAALAAPAALTACQNDVALGGPNTLVRVDSEPAGANPRATGGVAIRTGLGQGRRWSASR